MQDEYKCKDCINHKTPVCENCTQITSPGGHAQKPKHFCNADGHASEANAEVAALIVKITMKLVMGHPIPLSWVMRYNELAQFKE